MIVDLKNVSAYLLVNILAWVTSHWIDEHIRLGLKKFK